MGILSAGINAIFKLILSLFYFPLFGLVRYSAQKHHLSFHVRRAFAATLNFIFDLGLILAMRLSQVLRKHALLLWLKSLVTQCLRRVATAGWRSRELSHGQCLRAALCSIDLLGLFWTLSLIADSLVGAQRPEPALRLRFDQS